MAAHAPAYRRFFELFNQQQFWAAHEALEELWREDRSEFYRGLILLAAALVHVQRDNPAGCRKCLIRARRCLAPFAPRHGGLDVAAVLGRIGWMLDRLDALPPGQPLAAAIPYFTLEPEG